MKLAVVAVTNLNEILYYEKNNSGLEAAEQNPDRANLFLLFSLSSGDALLIGFLKNMGLLTEEP